MRSARPDSRSTAPAERLPALVRELGEARARTDAIFRCVAPEALRERPIPERHRLLFYLGHLEAFDRNLLLKRLPGDCAPNALDERLAFGIDPVEGDLPTDAPEDWPSVDAMRRYAVSVRAEIDARLRGGAPDAATARVLAEEPLLDAVLEHRWMHVETLFYMLHRLDPSRLDVPPPRAGSGRAEPATERVEIPAGATTLGAPEAAGAAFGWDNERREHRVEVPAFAIDATPVSNGAMLRFLRDGGYRDRALWTDDDWSWRERARIERPSFWREHSGRTLLRRLGGDVPLPLDEPAWVSHAEARAYARSAGAELPTEAQWHRAAFGAPSDVESPFPRGDEPAEPERGNFGRPWPDATPVDAHPRGASRFGVRDLVGNGWEWTSTPFAPFPGFVPQGFYPGYSADFFDGRHWVLKGGSPVTAPRLLRRSFRNWFQPHYRHVYAAFRCVGRR